MTNAFPNPNIPDVEPGLSKREWFTGMALQGLLAANEEDQDIIGWSVRMADLVLRELKYSEEQVIERMKKRREGQW